MVFMCFIKNPIFVLPCLAKKSGRALYRWDGKKIEHYDKKELAGRAIGWENKGPQVDFSQVFAGFTGSAKEPTQRGLAIGSDNEGNANVDVKFDDNSILWLPLRQPFLIQDGGGGSNPGSRQGELLRQIMEICAWALRTEDPPEEIDDKTWHGKTLLIGGMDGTLPRELKSVCHIIRWEYPTRLELRDFIFGQTGQYKNGVFDEAHKDHVIRSKGCGSLLDQIGQQSMFNLECFATSPKMNSIKTRKNSSEKWSRMLRAWILRIAVWPYSHHFEKPLKRRNPS